MTGKPGRPRSLTHEQIARAALADGLSDFSMPSVARRLGVAHSALYRYVADREALLVAGLDLAIRESAWPESDQDWDSLLRAIGDAVWDLCDANPGLDRAAVTSTRQVDESISHLTRYVESLHGQGFTYEDASVAVDFVIRLALNASAEMDRLRRIGSPLENTPDALKPFASDEVWTGRGWYDRQLGIVLTGVASLRVARSTS